MQLKQIPAREQIPASDTWDLTRLYATPDKWLEDFAALQTGYERIAQFKGRVGSAAQTLRDCLEFDKSLGMRIERLNHYASLKGSEDSANDENLKREGQLHNLLTKVAEATSFIPPEIQAINDAAFEKYLADPVLEPWRIALKKLRRLKPHTLSAAEERLLALGASVIHGHGETFSQLTNVDMKFGAVTDELGNELPLSQSSYSSFLVRREARVRKEAFHKFYAEFADHRYTLASSLAHSVSGDVFRARARNYPSARESSLLSTRCR